LAEIEALRQAVRMSRSSELDKRFADKIDKLAAVDELAPGVMKMVKRCSSRVKRNFNRATKWLAGHGNKGVIKPPSCPSKTCLISDDGTSVDVVSQFRWASPAGMNVGQILETPSGLGVCWPRPPDRRKSVDKLKT